MISQPMSADELSRLPVTVPIDVAARAFSLGSTKARQMARDGTFPCPVMRIGIRLLVLRKDLLAALGADPATGQPAPAEPPPPAPSMPQQAAGRLRLTIDGTPYDVSGDSEQVTDLIETSIRERRHTRLQLRDRQGDLIVNWPNVTTAVLAAAPPETHRRPRSTLGTGAHGRFDRSNRKYARDPRTGSGTR